SFTVSAPVTEGGTACCFADIMGDGAASAPFLSLSTLAGSVLDGLASRDSGLTGAAVRGRGPTAFARSWPGGAAAGGGAASCSASRLFSGTDCACPAGGATLNLSRLSPQAGGRVCRSSASRSRAGGCAGVGAEAGGGGAGGGGGSLRDVGAAGASASGPAASLSSGVLCSR